MAWQQSGRLLATQSRDKRLRVIDPRVSAADSAGDCVAAEADSHGGIKDSKVVWVGQNSDRILTTGFSTVAKLTTDAQSDNLIPNLQHFVLTMTLMKPNLTYS